MRFLYVNNFRYALVLLLIRLDPSKSVMSRIAGDLEIQRIPAPNPALDLSIQKLPSNLMKSNQLRFSETITKAPSQQNMNFGYPSPEQTKFINEFIKNHKIGRIYRVDEKGNFVDVPKDNWTLNHYCGRVVVLDDNNREIFDTGCCYSNYSLQTDWNMSEKIINFALLGFGKFALKNIAEYLRPGGNGEWTHHRTPTPPKNQPRRGKPKRRTVKRIGAA
ncbi:expressed protein [Phakopsora pachyrhizi]|uniref:Expressed protein n=1 Tax=Phakopsora pachyrhizi TaxID=170000 RepID=A0AAV0BDA2_PHAPC|nr:expressed protein [Phakopsora pachyrhizi]